MIIIGVTGGSGSGKSRLCEALARKGAYAIDADVTARKIVEKDSAALLEIVNFFGREILLEDGNLDRKKLGDIVFSNPEKLEELNKITHKHIMAAIMYELRKNKPDIAVIDAAVLFESGMDKMCTYIVTVTADKELRQRRIIERDNIDENTAMMRINAQHDDNYYTAGANYVVHNFANMDMEPYADEILKLAGGEDAVEG